MAEVVMTHIYSPFAVAFLEYFSLLTNHQCSI